MKEKPKLIFISGTGRSGTHLIGRTISSHRKIAGRIEVDSTFKLITKIATTQDYKNPISTFLNKKILRSRLCSILKNSEKHVLEKSHPSLWLAPFLIKEFNSKMILVYREVEPTVSSMLEHNDVMSWYKKLPLNRPNRFLGINKENMKNFGNYSTEEKCALRWESHYKTIFDLSEKYPDNTFLIKYDDFLVQPEPILERLSLFLEVDNHFKLEKFKVDSLDKWKEKLNENQLSRIRRISSLNKTSNSAK